MWSHSIHTDLSLSPYFCVEVCDCERRFHYIQIGHLVWDVTDSVKRHIQMETTLWYLLFVWVNPGFLGCGNHYRPRHLGHTWVDILVTIPVCLRGGILAEIFGLSLRIERETLGLDSFSSVAFTLKIHIEEGASWSHWKFIPSLEFSDNPVLFLDNQS